MRIIPGIPFSHCLNIDRNAKAPEGMDYDQEGDVWSYVQYVVSEMYAKEFDGIHWFYNESNDAVQICYWKTTDDAEYWCQEIPLRGVIGLRMLQRLRRCTRHRRRSEYGLYGTIDVIWQNEHKSLSVYSPHGWDVRLFVGAERPKTLPYDNVFIAERQLDKNRR